MADQTDGKGRPPKRRAGLTRRAEGADCRSRSSGGGPDGRCGLEEPVRPAGTDPARGQARNGSAHPEEIDWGEGVRPRSDGERKSKDY